MIKKIVLIIILVITLTQTVFAADNITVMINNEQIEFDVPPQIINERTMVPMRKIFETLGADVEWHGESQLIFATKDEFIIAMEIGQPSFSVTNVISGETKNIALESPAVIVNERTLVPVRAISESLGYDIDWNQETQTVLITNPAADKR